MQTKSRRRQPLYLTRRQVEHLLALAQWDYDQAEDLRERRVLRGLLRRLKKALEARPWSPV